VGRGSHHEALVFVEPSQCELRLDRGLGDARQVIRARQHALGRAQGRIHIAHFGRDLDGAFRFARRVVGLEHGR
jgi:hypothetical protein